MPLADRKFIDSKANFAVVYAFFVEVMFFSIEISLFKFIELKLSFFGESILIVIMI